MSDSLDIRMTHALLLCILWQQIRVEGDPLRNVLYLMALVTVCFCWAYFLPKLRKLYESPHD